MENVTFHFNWTSFMTSTVVKTTDMNTSIGAVASRTLQDFNDEEFRRRTVPVVYLSLLMIIGIPGNALVLLVFTFKIRKSTHRVFILFLAMLDLAVCTVSIPFSIIEMSIQYTFYAEGACKFFKFVNSFLIYSSLFVVLAMSCDRYRHVCCPMKIQLTKRRTKYVCCAALLAAMILTWPTLLVRGSRHVHVGNNLTGVDCSVSDKYVKTKSLLTYNIVNILTVFISLISLIVLYSLMRRSIHLHHKFRQKFINSPTAGSSDNKDNAVSKKSAQESMTSGSTRSIETQRKAIGVKVTSIAFSISFVLMVSFTPNLVLTTLHTILGYYVAPAGEVSSAIMPIVSRSLYINNIANPILYSILDSRFRHFSAEYGRTAWRKIKSLFRGLICHIMET